MSIGQLFAELAAPIKRASFAGKRGVLLGIGGLGNPAAIAIALDRSILRCRPRAINSLSEKTEKTAYYRRGFRDRAKQPKSPGFVFQSGIAGGSKAQVAASVLQKIDPQGF